MTTWFVSRHPGAQAWARRHGVNVDRRVEHLDIAEVKPGDTVIGSLPVNLAAEVCARNARYLHLSLRVPPELRGVELDADTLDALGAQLQPYHVSPVVHRPEISASDSAAPGTRTLISFLCTTDYQRIGYCWPARGGEVIETPYVSAALARMTRPAQIVLLATPAAKEKHGAALRGELERLAPGCPVRFEAIDEGKTPQELWQIFALLEREMSRGGEILLDITHGFRSLPLFASAVVAYRRVIAPQATPVTVCYGAFEARDAEGRAPIWDLTAAAELADWSAAIGGFLKTGHAEPLVQALDTLANRLNRLWATGGRHGPRPRVRQFAKALRVFANDLATVRVASLIVGRDRGSAKQAKFDTPSAQVLLRALDEAEGDIVNHIPPLAPVLEQMRQRIAPLCTGTLEGDAGERALAELARLYLQLARYPEAAIVLREAWTSRYAPPEARVPSRGFSFALREQADRRYALQAPHARDFSKVRNDIEHGGFNADPQPADRLRKAIEDFLEIFEKGMGAQKKFQD